MDLEHMYLWMISKRALSDVGLRVLIYVQIALKVGPSPEKRIVFISRRRICKRLSISIGACRAAIKQLVDLGFIQLCDSKGNKVEDLSSNWMILNRKEKLNWDRIKTILQEIESPTGPTDRGSANDSGSEGLFDNIMNE
ncbi:MAG: winged helix-turn-helix transcriptional regulator [Pseudobdellovibrio sp.]